MGNQYMCKIFSLGRCDSFEREKIEGTINGWLEENPTIKIENIQIVQTSDYITDAMMLVFYK